MPASVSRMTLIGPSKNIVMPPEAAGASVVRRSPRIQAMMAPPTITMPTAACRRMNGPRLGNWLADSDIGGGPVAGDQFSDGEAEIDRYADRNVSFLKRPSPQRCA